jgi:hypothetical protein
MGGPGRGNQQSMLWSWLRVAAIAIVLLAPAAACGESPTTPAAVPLRAELTDASGDADGLMDLVAGTVEVTSNVLTLLVRFVPGTIDLTRTTMLVYFDTDQNQATGTPVDAFMGMDYVLSIAAFPVGGGFRATLARCPTQSPACSLAVATPPVNVTADTMSVTIPLAAFGNDDGRLDVRCFSREFISLGTGDYMPDLALAPARTR